MSGTGELTRPMMEKVRSAAFDMLLSRCGSMAGLPEGSSWLDLFAGTAFLARNALAASPSTCVKLISTVSGRAGLLLVE